MSLFRIYIEGRQPTDVDGDIFAALAAAEGIYLVEIDVLGGDDGDLEYVSPGLAWKLDWADGPRTRLDLFVDGRYCGIGVERVTAVRTEVPSIREIRVWAGAAWNAMTVRQRIDLCRRIRLAGATDWDAALKAVEAAS